MRLSIVQRTIAGFVIMFVLLAILGGISYFNTTAINLSLNKVTQETTPLVVSSTNLKQALLKNNLSYLKFRTTDIADELDAYQQSFNSEQQTFEQISQQLSSSSALDPSLQGNFN